MRAALIELFWFTLYIVLCAIILLGLAALYVEHGMLTFWIGVVIVCGISLVGLNRRPIYIIEPPPPTSPPPGKQALPPPTAPQIGRACSVLTRQQRRWP
jgi:hypothetical protein